MSDAILRPEMDPRLQRLSDTDIVLNFAAALGALYPYMRTVGAHCYDPYDDVVEPLFHALVFGSFSGKYGVFVPRDQCHTYEAEVATCAPVHHIRVVPKRFPLEAISSGEARSISEAELVGRYLVFINFGDGLHSLTSGELEGSSYDLSFHLTRVAIVDERSQTRIVEHDWLWVPNSNVTYEFVEAGGLTRRCS